MVDKWITKESHVLEVYRIFKVNRVIRESLKGSKGDFFTVDAPNWVTVVPVLLINGVEHFILVKQYRHGSDSITLEFPAGMVDIGEIGEDTAKRELLEETGYISKNLVKVGDINPNPAFMTNTTITYVARDLNLVSKQNLDEHEEIEVVYLETSKFDKLIGSSEVNSAITLQAYYFYLRSIPSTQT